MVSDFGDLRVYVRRRRFGTLESVDVKRSRQLEQENTKRNKLLAERDWIATSR
jgi:hypothetical protein